MLFPEGVVIDGHSGSVEPSTLVEVTSKSVDRTRYVAEFRAALSAFLARAAS